MTARFRRWPWAHEAHVGIEIRIDRFGKAKTMFETSVASIRIWLGGARTRAQLPDERAAQETRSAEAKTAEDAHRAAEAKADADSRFAAEAKAAEEAHRTAEAKAAEEARRTAEAKAAEDARRSTAAKAAEGARHAAKIKAVEDEGRGAEAEEPPRTPSVQKPKPTKAHIAPQKEKPSRTRDAP
jgi:fused signal recognition particle receptor